MAPVAERKPTSCLLFDYGGTLDCAGVPWKEQFRRLYEAEGLDLAGAAFDRIFYDADDPLVGGMSAGDDLDATVRQLVANLEQGLKPWLPEDGRRAARVAERFLGATREALARNRPVLAALRRRYRLGIVSNFYGNLDAVCRGLGIDSLFDVIVDSQVIGFEKPEPAIFHAAMEPLGAEPGTTVMIGDSPHRDGEGARRSGLRFIQVAAAIPHAPTAADQAVICDLAELAELLS